MTLNDFLWIWRPWLTPLVVILLCYFGYKMLRQLGSNTYSNTPSGLDQLVASIFPLKYFMPFLAILFLILPDSLKNGANLGPMPILGAVIALASFGAAWRYEHHQASVRALLLMIDVGLLALGTAVLIGMINVASEFAKNYSLYRDHVNVYGAVVLACALGVLLTKVPGRIRHQIVTLRSYAETGITSGELYEVLTAAKGKQVIKNWGPQRFAAIMAPLAVVFTSAGAWGGGDYMLYACFLLFLPVAGLLVSLAMIRRAYMLRYLPTQDVIILDRSNR